MVESEQTLEEAPDAAADEPPADEPLVQPPPATDGRDDNAGAPWLGGVLTLGIFYYAVVWRNMPGSTLVKAALATLLAGIVVVVVVSRQANKKAAFRTARDQMVLLSIVLAAGFIAIYFAAADKSMLLKLFVVGYFSFLPPWLYVQFLSSRGRTLWEEYVLNLFRLRIDRPENLPEPPRASRYHRDWRLARGRAGLHEIVVSDGKGGVERVEPQNVYEKKFAGHYGAGPNLGHGIAALRGDKLFPVAMATLLVSLGWVMVVQPESIWNMRLFGVDLQPSGRPQVPFEIMCFGFLGAYFFIVQMLARRYFQNDLKPGAYVNATLRIVIVVLLVWVLDFAVGDSVGNGVKAATAFAIGVFPQMGLQIVMSLIKAPWSGLVPSLKQAYPLSDLDGMNVWYEARLLEEGIEDLQNLATANLVDVMLNTRVPMDRLVDWVDQSMLYLHVDDGEDVPEAANQPPSHRERLRTYGIRAATDLDDVLALNHESLDDDSLKWKQSAEEFQSRMLRLLNTADNEPSALLSVSRALENEPNLFHVRAWKRLNREDSKLMLRLAVADTA